MSHAESVHRKQTCNTRHGRAVPRALTTGARGFLFTISRCSHSRRQPNNGCCTDHGGAHSKRHKLAGLPPALMRLQGLGLRSVNSGQQRCEGGQPVWYPHNPQCAWPAACCGEAPVCDCSTKPSQVVDVDGQHCQDALPAHRALGQHTTEDGSERHMSAAQSKRGWQRKCRPSTLRKRCVCSRPY